MFLNLLTVFEFWFTFIAFRIHVLMIFQYVLNDFLLTLLRGYLIPAPPDSPPDIPTIPLSHTHTHTHTPLFEI